jgi:hypothetical protein
VQSDVSASQLAVFDDWASEHNLTFIGARQSEAFSNFKSNMVLLKQINTDPSITYW